MFVMYKMIWLHSSNTMQGFLAIRIQQFPLPPWQHDKSHIAGYPSRYLPKLTLFGISSFGVSCHGMLMRKLIDVEKFRLHECGQ